MTDATKILSEVLRERRKQDAKWGEQNHPNVCPVLTGRDGGASAERVAADLEIPTEFRAKFLCSAAFHRGEGTFAHILIEEVAEAIAEFGDDAALRIELIQVAAVAVNWIECIDRRTHRRNHSSMEANQ